MAVTEFNITCPYCGRVNEAHRGAVGATPKEGDVSLCWRCLSPAIYTADLNVRKATTEEAAEIRSHPEYQAAVDAATRFSTPEAAADTVWGMASREH